MAIPEKYHLDAVRKLRGDALVTFPGSDLSIKKVERVYTMDRGQALPAYLTADAEHTTAKLTEQYIVGGDQQHVEVYQLFEVLPGVVLIAVSVDSETGAIIKTYTQRILDADYSPSVLGSALEPGFFIIDFNKQPINDIVSVNTQVAMELPDTRTEYVSMAFQFPALFAFLDGWAIPAPSPYQRTGPFPGIDYDLLGHRTNSKPAEVVFEYAIGPVGPPSDTYEVHTPGVASREFNIPLNTIHDAIAVYEDPDGADPAVQIEDIAASTPSSYTPGSTECVIRSSARRWRGEIWETQTVTVREN